MVKNGFQSVFLWPYGIPHAYKCRASNIFKDFNLSILLTYTPIMQKYWFIQIAFAQDKNKFFCETAVGSLSGLYGKKSLKPGHLSSYLKAIFLK